MLDLARCRNILAVGASLGLVVLAINFVLLGAAGPFPRWLVTEHIPMGWDFLDENDALVAGVLAESRQGKTESNRCFSVYIGKSTAHYDVDPEILAAHDGLNCRYLGLWGQGEGLHDLDLLARPLLASDLRPCVALLCIHPAFLAGRAAEKLEDPRDPFPPPAKGRWQEVIGMVGRCNWIQGKVIKIYINHAIRTALYNARTKMFEHLRLNWDAFRAPDRDPWRPRPHEELERGVPADQVSKRFQTWSRLGCFDLEQYNKYQKSISALLIGVIKGFQRRGTEVILVLMPETEAIRERVPLEARRHLEEELAIAFAGAPPVLLDFQRSMPDSRFLDHVHLNSTGRKEFTLLLARAIQEAVERERGTDSMSSPRDPAPAVTDRRPGAGQPARPAVASADRSSFPASPLAMPNR